jgi:hypothetical protein
VQRVRVRERVLISDLAVERELLDLVEVDLLRPSRVGPAPIAAAVDQNAHQPGRSSGRTAQLPEPAEGLQQAVLDRILSLLANQPPRYGVEAG